MKDIEAAARNEWNSQTEKVIKSALRNQQIAVEEFATFLFWRRQCFKRAWNEYRTYCETMNYAEYKASGLYPKMLRQQGRTRPENPIPKFKKLCGRVLSYAIET